MGLGVEAKGQDASTVVTCGVLGTQQECDQPNLAPANFVPLKLATIVADATSNWSNSNGYFLVQVSGVYSLSVNAKLSVSTPQNKALGVGYSINGNTTADSMTYASIPANQSNLSLSKTLNLVAGS